MTFKGKATLKNFAPKFNEDDENHIDMLKNIAQHIDMEPTLLSYLNRQSTARTIFGDTTVEDRVFALIVSLRDAAAKDEEASVLLQRIGHLFVEGINNQEKVLHRRQPYHR